MSNKSIQTLENMVGKTYMYNARHYTIRGYIEEGDLVEIQTDKKTFRQEKTELHNLLEEFLPVDHGPETSLENVESGEVPAEVQQSITHEQQEIANLRSILMDNISKVKEDPNYIPQAKEVQQNVNTILNMSKHQLDLARETRKITRNQK